LDEHKIGAPNYTWHSPGLDPILKHAQHGMYFFKNKNKNYCTQHYDDITKCRVAFELN
jgi:hypothetical protein